jgi:hypothetical protein
MGRIRPDGRPPEAAIPNVRYWGAVLLAGFGANRTLAAKSAKLMLIFAGRLSYFEAGRVLPARDDSKCGP